MSSLSEDKEWASKYLLGPLTSPEPSQVTGPGTHFGSAMDRKIAPTTNSPASSSQSKFSSRNPFRDPPQDKALIDVGEDEPSGMGSGKSHSRGPQRPRTSSLTQRYPGDVSHRPLDIIRKQTKLANQAPHLKKKHLPRADIIDSLDATMDQLYHHEGPYDATLLARNTSKNFSPIDAVRGSNAEALKATPKEHIKDALDKHVPLYGTATAPPGSRLISGEVMNYAEGADLMRETDAEGGAYKRWEGVKYLPGDYKGKGEPTFTEDRSRNKKPDHRRVASEDNSIYEMQPTNSRQRHQRSTSSAGHELRRPSARNSLKSQASNSMKYSDFERDTKQNNSVGRKFGEGLKRTFGSLRKKKRSEELPQGE